MALERIDLAPQLSCSGAATSRLTLSVGNLEGTDRGRMERASLVKVAMCWPNHAPLSCPSLPHRRDRQSSRDRTSPERSSHLGSQLGEMRVAHIDIAAQRAHNMLLQICMCGFLRSQSALERGRDCGCDQLNRSIVGERVDALAEGRGLATVGAKENNVRCSNGLVCCGFIGWRGSRRARRIARPCLVGSEWCGSGRVGRRVASAGCGGACNAATRAASSAGTTSSDSAVRQLT